jgi:hypothetical protein
MIDVDSSGDPYVLNDKGDIYAKPSSTWIKKGSEALSVAVGPSDDLWKISRVDNLPYTYNAGTTAWEKRGDTEAAWLAIGPTWQWISKKSDFTFARKTGTGITYNAADSISGTAKDIDIGADGTVYIISGVETTGKGYIVYKQGVGGVWELIANTPTKAMSIAVDTIG